MQYMPVGHPQSQWIIQNMSKYLIHLSRSHRVCTFSPDGLVEIQRQQRTCWLLLHHLFVGYQYLATNLHVKDFTEKLSFLYLALYVGEQRYIYNVWQLIEKYVLSRESVNCKQSEH